VTFWDTSALLPLFVDEDSTERCQRLVAADPDIAVWEATSVELLSALARYRRSSQGADDLLALSRREILDRWITWTHVSDLPAVKTRAHRLVNVHPLRAADALQLGAALLLCDDRPELLPLVTRDRQLAAAAEAEGFDVARI
jgi:predicted nucleic acid-binding protein